MHYRWSVEVISVYSNDKKYIRFGDHGHIHIRTMEKKRFVIKYISRVAFLPLMIDK